MASKNPMALVKKIVSSLMACSKTISFYPMGHPQTQNEIEQLWEHIVAFLKSKPQLVLSFSAGEIFFEHDLLVEESLSCATLIKTCANKKINRIAFLSGLTQGELAGFLSLLTKENGPEGADLARALAQAEISHIEVKRLLSVESEHGDATSRANPLQRHERQYNVAVTGLSEIFDQAGDDRPVAIDRVDAIVEWLVGSLGTGDSTILALTALKEHDEYTCHHSINVAMLAVALAHRLGLNRQRLVWLATGALLHDIGKVNIPKEIINKPGRLTAEEWRLMKRHPIESTQILSGLPSLEPSALIVAFEHHIGYDLSGYPVRAEGRTPHLFSRIVQIADTYDGLTSRRSYHEPSLPTEALNYMLCVMPQAFDPALLNLFVKSLGVYPVGSVVRLNTDQVALVVGENRDDLLRPKVKLLDDAAPGRLIDLAGSRLSIDRIMSPAAAGVDLTKELLSLP
ncbi:MAG: HD-GYP domain-containing protein [Actinomycetota bacterium]|nr:HD-GYP domain-containing protein [Actinomycetota bacterium]